MALVYPPQFRSAGHESERPAYVALSRLPDPWRVFHGVGWVAPGGVAIDGEADFVLIHPEHGLFVLENKGGDVVVHDGIWYRRYRGGLSEIPKNPFEQATSSKHQLLRYLSSRAGLGFVRAGHGVVLPEVAIDGDLGPAAPREVIFDRNDLEDPKNAVQRMISYWGGRSDRIPDGVLDQITQLLAPTLQIRPLLKDDIDDVRARLIRLTDEQVRLLDLIGGNRSFIAYGGAGTGKTVLAVEQAKRLVRSGFADEGKPVLLVCFNQLLGDHLVDLLADEPGIEAGRFLSLCRRFAAEAGERMPVDPPASWWDEDLPALAADALERAGRRFSAVIVDEGQDFHPYWWDYLRMMSGVDAPFYVFADPHQAIFRSGWQPPFEEPNFVLRTNCRNTLQIARQVADIFDDPVEVLGVDGPDVERIEATTDAEIARALRSTLQRLSVNERLAPEQVVILCDRRRLVDRLRDTKFANQRLVEPGMRGVVVESIHRFKGLESDSVILIRTTEPDEDGRMLSYVGLSRARAHLTLISPSS